MFLTPTHPMEIYKTIISLKSKKSSGHDNLSATFLKEIDAEMSYPLSIIINKSFAEGTVPDALKIAKIIPIYKSKEHDLFSNYRPISLLPTISKILEKTMHKRLFTFLESNKLLYQSQYGFRKNHSTTQAILEFVTKTVAALEDKKSTLAVFLDLSKAFDTINHGILLHKLEFYGIRGIAYDWIKSYLDNRKQFVVYNSCKSVEMSISCGVPQGSVLGPLLFLIYMNDLPDCLNNVNNILFADDTTLYQSARSIDDLYKTINIDLVTLSDWLKANKLSLNISKTKYMLFSNKRLTGLNNLEVMINNTLLVREQCLKFLGIYIDENLTWNQHIQIIKSKLASTIYAMNRLKHFIPCKYKLTLYFSLIYPYLVYGIPVWGSAYDKHINKLIIMQKKVIRIICGTKYNEHTNPLFCQLDILKLNDIYKMEVCKLVLKFKQNNLPAPLMNIFILNNDIYKRRTRQYTNLHVPKCRTTLATQSVTCKGPQLWNALPHYIKDTPSLTCKQLGYNLVKLFVHGYKTV
jgi:hypothetical protein